MAFSAREQTELLGKIAEGKRIFSSLEDAFKKPEPTCLLVTSAARGEGKTLTAAGLGVLAAHYTSKSVLAVDLNWFSPSLHTCFGLDQTCHIGQLRDKVRLDDLVKPSGYENLSILAAPLVSGGQEGATESQLAAAILEEAKSAYEVVIVDSASVFPANRYMIDPISVAKNADDTIIVVLANVTARQEVKRAAMTLVSAGARVSGMIVNQWKNPLAQRSYTRN
jgi:protein-tyrosine kinase